MRQRRLLAPFNRTARWGTDGPDVASVQTWFSYDLGATAQHALPYTE